jgi:hypothetical protein
MSRSLALVFVLIAVAGCRSSSSESARSAVTGAEPAPSAVPPPPPERTPSPESLERKARSEARLRAEGIRVNAALPVIETAAEARIRSQDAVVDRAIASLIVALKGEGVTQGMDAAEIEKMVEGVRDRYGAANALSPKERAFVDDPRPAQQAAVQFVWRYEVLAVLLWALGYEADLAHPAHVIDAGLIVGVVKEAGPEGFRSKARLRSATEILDEADLIYRYDWACVDARASGGEPPKGIDCEVVVERHRALNWLIGYQGQAWDDVSTDT